MKRNYIFILLATATLVAVSCVSPKKLAQSEAKYSQLNGAYLDMQNKYRELQGDLAASKNQNTDLTNQLSKQRAESDLRIKDLSGQVDYLKQNNSQVLNQLKDLSVITGSQAESIKKSLDNIGAKDGYIKGLQSSIARKDSMNMVLVMNLKGAIGNLDDKDINIKVDKSVVYIDISDKLLFKNASYDITEKAKSVLGKVAKVLAAQQDLEFMVEGHTDSIAFKNGLLIDNWDLSVKRATTIVRLLQDQYGLNPKHITAAGRGQYLPLADNSTAEGRASNRRTRIVILPQLDQFFKLLEKK